jgi:hypothetical protein
MTRPSGARAHQNSGESGHISLRFVGAGMLARTADAESAFLATLPTAPGDEKEPANKHYRTRHIRRPLPISKNESDDGFFRNDSYLGLPLKLLNCSTNSQAEKILRGPTRPSAVNHVRSPLYWVGVNNKSSLAVLFSCIRTRRR